MRPVGNVRKPRSFGSRCCAKDFSRASSFKATLDKVKPAGRVKPAGYNVLRHAVAESWTGKSYKSMFALPDLAAAGAFIHARSVTSGKGRKSTLHLKRPECVES